MRTHFSSYPRPILRALLILFSVFALLAAGFLLLVRFVQGGQSAAFDKSVLLAVNALSTPALDTTMRIVTDFGSIGVAVAAVVIVLVYLRQRHTYRALFIVAALGGSALLSVFFKLLFSRPRPDLWQHLVTEETFSFPSGHAIASSALAVSVIVLLWRTKYRWLAVVLGVIYVLVIGFSRMYLGVHYPTDIIAGWIVSIAWVLLVATILWHRRKVRDIMRTLDNTTK